MDRKGKKAPGPSSSSFTADLFGPNKDSSKSSTGYFESIFGPQSKGHMRDTTTHPGYEHSYNNAKHNTNTTDIYDNSRKGQSTKKEKNQRNYENERSVEPCYYNSSIYYGGQENYTTHTSQHISPPHNNNNFKKDGEEDDANESDSNGASRGNWWKGSLYY